jgi:hypothetical protein
MSKSRQSGSARSKSWVVRKLVSCLSASTSVSGSAQRLFP